VKNLEWTRLKHGGEEVVWGMNYRSLPKRPALSLTEERLLIAKAKRRKIKGTDLFFASSFDLSRKRYLPFEGTVPVIFKTTG